MTMCGPPGELRRLIPHTAARGRAMKTTTLTVYYDGLCPLCSREIDYYRKRVTTAAVHFVDIADWSFNARTEGLDPRRIHRVMHVKVNEEVRTGLEAFIAIWDVVPGFGWLARLARTPGFHGLMTVGYRVFALVRPWLPRRRAPCESGFCRR
jgi:predicted DCC family thiol-disulfide oxidoreductase YuxK